MSQPKLATTRSGWGGRGYKIPGRPKVYPSITTIHKQVAKPGLMQWIADQTAAFAVANLPYLVTQTEEIGWARARFFWSRKADINDPLRAHHAGVRNDAAELGTNIHEWIEAHLDGLTEYPEILAIETEEMIDAFLDWLDVHEVIPHRAEFTVVNDELEYAGTADADWEIRCLHDKACPGLSTEELRRCLIDLKSSRNTWREHGMQLAAIGNAKRLMVEVPERTEGALKAEKTEVGVKVKSWWIEQDAPEFSCYGLLHIRPTDLDTQGNRIPAFCSFLDRTEDIDLYFDGFKGALMLAKSEYEIKARVKARGMEYDETEEDL